MTHAAKVNATVVFSMNCVAVVPLAAVCTDLYGVNRSY